MPRGKIRKPTFWSALRQLLDWRAARMREAAALKENTEHLKRFVAEMKKINEEAESRKGLKTMREFLRERGTERYFEKRLPPE